MNSAAHTVETDTTVTLTVTGCLIAADAAVAAAFDAALATEKAIILDIAGVTAIGQNGAALLLGLSRNKQAALRINATQRPLINLLRIGNSPGANFSDPCWWTITVA
jgi:anti-anti-sigma regulatory factor